MGLVSLEVQHAGKRRLLRPIGEPDERKGARLTGRPGGWHRHDFCDRWPGRSSPLAEVAFRRAGWSRSDEFLYAESAAATALRQDDEPSLAHRQATRSVHGPHAVHYAPMPARVGVVEPEMIATSARNQNPSPFPAPIPGSDATGDIDGRGIRRALRACSAASTRRNVPSARCGGSPGPCDASRGCNPIGYAEHLFSTRGGNPPDPSS